MDLDMQLSLDIKGKKFDGNIRDIMKINEAILTEEFVKQPGTYAWFAALMEIASAEIDSKKFNLSVLEANLDKEKRVFLSKDGKVTEAMVRSAIITDKIYIDLNTELLEISRQYGILKAIVRSLEQRKDMLIQIGSMKRTELSLGDFNIDMDKVREKHK